MLNLHSSYGEFAFLLAGVVLWPRFFFTKFCDGGRCEHFAWQAWYFAAFGILSSYVEVAFLLAGVVLWAHSLFLKFL